ncbi:MAG: NADH-quinone oxidoreductase subunit C [Candidatus Marsarchaeota archaeon]|nr:NADH-quinone oxidoreductase subunit C [Candidatus Marsarchaeota archaeon]MCL5112586.1 NADH-quinone oxidoreductase subunit C [Candidatus Marsarchaeota archaeon]
MLKKLGELKAKGYSYLKKITAVDYPDRFEVIYILHNLQANDESIISVKLPHDKPSIESVIGIFKSADWYEREMYEMFGIEVTGRVVKRLLLEEWNSGEYPLRKDFEWGKEYKKAA